MVSIQPELWVESADQALDFYRAAFGARVVHRVGHGDEIVAQLEIGGASFWIGAPAPNIGRFTPTSFGGATSRTLLVVDDPDSVVRRALAAGGTEKSPIGGEHGWRIGRVVDPFGQEWEIGKPTGPWPPS